jgi:hypothetical protein
MNPRRGQDESWRAAEAFPAQRVFVFPFEGRIFFLAGVERFIGRRARFSRLFEVTPLLHCATTASFTHAVNRLIRCNGFALARDPAG